ncbi:MAG: type IV secretion system protein VirB10 [Gammaproteobacteria bacterium]
MTTLLTIGCMGLMAVGLLGWYYSNALTRHQRAQKAVESKSQQRAQGEMTLPPLGRVTPPRLASTPSETAPVADPSALDALLGPPPELARYPLARATDPAVPQAYRASTHTARPKSADELALERRLAGAVSSRESASANGKSGAAAAPNSGRLAGDVDVSSASPYLTSPITRDAVGPTLTSMRTQTASDSASNDVQTLLRAETTPAVEARVLPTQRFLLPKGSFLDCTLETAIDSTLPGLVTCVTATDVFGVDGTTVLIERGSKLFGETRGQVRQGGARVFVLWTEARTPTGVVVALASPGTDELGRSGLPGVVDRHFFDRFGAAMLISILDSTAQAATNRSGTGSTVVLNPAGSQDVVAEVLRSTVNIPPTVRKHQGDRIQVLVARDVDFRGVYDLRATSAR